MRLGVSQPSYESGFARPSLEPINICVGQLPFQIREYFELH